MDLSPINPVRMFTIEDREGPPMAVIHDAKGNQILMSVEASAEFTTCGYSTNVFPRRNVRGKGYPCIKITIRDGRGTKNADLLLARLVAARLILEHEALTGQRASAKGWVVKYRNGDPFDLRDENIMICEANGRRNGFVALWDLRARKGLVAKGLSPDAVSKARRAAEQSNVR